MYFWAGPQIILEIKQFGIFAQNQNDPTLFWFQPRTELVSFLKCYLLNYLHFTLCVPFP